MPASLWACNAGATHMFSVLVTSQEGIPFSSPAVNKYGFSSKLPVLLLCGAWFEALKTTKLQVKHADSRLEELVDQRPPNAGHHSLEGNSVSIAATYRSFTEETSKTTLRWPPPSSRWAKPPRRLSSPSGVREQCKVSAP